MNLLPLASTAAPQWLISLHPAGKPFMEDHHISSGISFLFVFFTVDTLPDATLPIYPGLEPAIHFTGLWIWSKLAVSVSPKGHLDMWTREGGDRTTLPSVPLAI